MPLDPRARAYLEQLASVGIQPTSALTPAQARAEMEAASRLLGRPPAVARVEDRRIAGPGGEIRIRITTPRGPGPFPALVYFHGGGWVIGSIETHDNLCR